MKATHKPKSVFDRLNAYAGKYHISFQMWGEGNYNMYIEKGDVGLNSFGGCETAEECMLMAIEYLDRINKKHAHG